MCLIYKLNFLDRTWAPICTPAPGPANAKGGPGCAGNQCIVLRNVNSILSAPSTLCSPCSLSLPISACHCRLFLWCDIPRPLVSSFPLRSQPHSLFSKLQFLPTLNLQIILLNVFYNKKWLHLIVVICVHSLSPLLANTLMDGKVCFWSSLVSCHYLANIVFSK